MSNLLRPTNLGIRTALDPSMLEELMQNARQMLHPAPSPEQGSVAPSTGVRSQALREWLSAATERLNTAFRDGHPVRQLVALRAYVVDQAILAIWEDVLPECDDDLALLAVGGYGRAELFPFSDVDLLVLARDAQSLERSSPDLERFVTRLWDLGLDIGQSVRTLEDCRELAQTDVTVATNLLETRRLTGSKSLALALQKLAYSDDTRSDAAFFELKLEEQAQRHQRYSDSEYNLEPNLKTSPGGLRDIQTVNWIAKRHRGRTVRGNEQRRFEFLTDDERQSLHEAEGYLWTLRYGLQMLAGRNENRLLFDYQRLLAEMLGLRDREGALAIEQLMKRYYRFSMVLRELNDVLLQFFSETILARNLVEQITPLNRRFQLRNGYLEIVDSQVFIRSPFALMEVFLLFAQTPEIRGMRAGTIRSIRAHRHLIDHRFRQNLANTSLFMNIVSNPLSIHAALSAMRRYGVLGRYIPEFGRIMGQMQHDLFHIYTVDAHTMRVLRNLADFYKPESLKEFPLAAWLVQRLPKPELLFLAGLFHDIAKGRGGDHSELGCQDVERFCQRHHISERDTSLVSWLVRHHLLMSVTAQRKDPSDPGVIHEFARRIPSQMHLDYLYILTVADIGGTNPSLWNNWRAALLRQLYSETVRSFRHGLSQFDNRKDWIRATRAEVREMLKTAHPHLPGAPCTDEQINSLWDEFDDEYFLQDSTIEIAWQLRVILQHQPADDPLVRIKDARGGTADGFLQVMVYMPWQAHLFTVVTAGMEQMGLNIVDARMTSIGRRALLGTFVISAMDSHTPDRETLARRLHAALQSGGKGDRVVEKRVPRQLKHFTFPTSVVLSNDTANGRTVMEVSTPDRPGLLARIAEVLQESRVLLVSARIVTLGERVEDVFLLTDYSGSALKDAEVCQQLSDNVRTRLDQTNQ